MSDLVMHVFACIGLATVILIGVSLVVIAISIKNAPHDPDDEWRDEIK